MMQFFQARWLAVLLGILTYGGTTWLVLQPAKQFDRAAKLLRVAGERAPLVQAGPSWTFQNPELTQALTELRTQQEAQRARGAELEAWEARLKAERQEIIVVTQTVARLQADLDKTVTRVREEELTNLRKLAKLYATMSPQGAARILLEMEDDQSVKILSVMKEAESAPILEFLAQGDKQSAKRAALLSDRLRLVSLDPKKPRTP